LMNHSFTKKSLNTIDSHLTHKSCFTLFLICFPLLHQIF